MPLVQEWLQLGFAPGETIYLVIDRTSWQEINLFTVSVVWQKRSLPVYFQLLGKKGNSNLSEQTKILGEILPLLKRYKVCVLGDREFCSIDLANWLWTQEVSFTLRWKKNILLNRNQVYGFS